MLMTNENKKLTNLKTVYCWWSPEKFMMENACDVKNLEKQQFYEKIWKKSFVSELISVDSLRLIEVER